MFERKSRMMRIVMDKLIRAIPVQKALYFF